MPCLRATRLPKHRGRPIERPVTLLTRCTARTSLILVLAASLLAASPSDDEPSSAAPARARPTPKVRPTPPKRPAAKPSDGVVNRRPVRKGFSLEIGIGYGAIVVTGLDRYTGQRQDRGFEPHALSLGGFLTNDLALFFRWKSTYHGTSNAEGKTAHRFVGTQTANLQWWFSDRGFLGGGAGLAIFGFGFGRSRDDPGWTFGGALDARVGFALARWTHHLITLSYEVVAGIFDKGAAVGLTVNLGYQYY